MEETEEFPMNELGRQLGIHESTSEIENGERCGLLDEFKRIHAKRSSKVRFYMNFLLVKSTICLLLIQP